MSDTIKINEFAEKISLALTDIIPVVEDGTNTNYKTTLNKLQTFLNTIGVLGVKGVINTASAAPTEDGIYLPTEDGTYTNYGGEIISLNDNFIVIAVFEGQTEFTQISYPITSSGYVSFTDVKNTFNATDEVNPSTMKATADFIDANNPTLKLNPSDLTITSSKVNIDGTIGSSGAISRTDFIDVSNYKSIKYNGSARDLNGINYFDEFQDFISGEALSATDSVVDFEGVKPENCKYVIFQSNTSLTPTFDAVVSPYKSTELSEKINNTITLVNENIGKLENIIKNTNGYYRVGVLSVGDVFNGNVTADANTNYQKISCKEGDKFILSNIGGQASRAWCFVNSNNEIISYSDASVNYLENPEVITAPANSEIVYFNNLVGTTSDGFVLRFSDLGEKVVLNLTDNISSELDAMQLIIDTYTGTINSNTNAINNEITARTSAIANEVSNRNTAIQDALDNYSGAPATATLQTLELTNSLTEVPASGVVKDAIDNLKGIDLLRDSITVNDALNQTAASAVEMAFDVKTGLMGCVYMAGANGSYGEVYGWIELSLFSPADPNNKKFIEITREPLTTEQNIYNLGNGIFRIFYLTRTKTSVYKYKDYDAINDTLSAETNLKINIGGTLYDVTRSVIDQYLTDEGFTDYADDNFPIIMTTRFTEYDNKVWGSLTCSGGYYPVVFTSTDNLATITPYEIVPYKGRYECMLEWNNSIMHTLVRGGAGTIYYLKWNGISWTTEIPINDAAESRPMIMNYKGNVIIGVTYTGSAYVGFPDVNGGRRGLKILSGNDTENDPNNWTELVKFTSKYGFVYFTWYNIFDDLYMSYSQSQLPLEVLQGLRTNEQGKEEVKFVKWTL